MQACAPEKKKKKKSPADKQAFAEFLQRKFLFSLRLFLEVRLLLRSRILSHNLRSFLVLWEIFEAAEIIEVQSDKGLDKF